MMKPSAVQTQFGLVVFLGLVILFSMISCRDNSAERPDGWTEETHGSDAAADYDTVFAQGMVNRLDITIKPADWRIMMLDLAVMLGGLSRLLGQVPDDDDLPAVPASMKAACEGREVRDNCTWSVFGQSIEGTCAAVDEDLTICLPITKYSSLDQLPREPVFRPCTVSFNGTVWRYVGIRCRGNSSLVNVWKEANSKFSFSLDFDEFEQRYPAIENQRFYGFKNLALMNNFADVSLMREKITADIFREASVSAPRTAFYRLFIDFGKGPVYFGLYTLVELPRSPMLETQFSGSGGNLYKPEGYGARWIEFDQESFEKKTNKNEADWSDVKAAISALQASREDADAWRAGLEKVFNVSGFLQWLAVNTVIQNWDTYGNMHQNYYLYNDPGDGVIHWIPWDNNLALGARISLFPPVSLDLSEVDDSWPLIRFLMDDPVYRTAYRTNVNEFVGGAFDPETSCERFRREHELIEPYVTGTEGEIPGYTFLHDPDDFDAELDYLCEHAAKRSETVSDFMKSERVDPAPPE